MCSSDLGHFSQIAPVATYDQFEAAITAQFSVIDEAEKARDTLDSLKQTSSVAALNQRFNETLLLIPPDERSKDVDLRHMYIKKLKPSVRLQVRLAEPKSLAQAMEIADRVDSVRILDPFFKRESAGESSASSFESSDVVHDSAQSDQTHEQSEPEPMVLGSVRMSAGQYQKKSKPLTEEEREMLREQNGCFYCRKPNAGHQARDCPVKKSGV